MSSIPGVGNLFKAFNPLEMAIDFGASLLNLPPEITAAAKITVGAATGNVLMVASGSIDLLSSVAGKAATTEYAPSSDPSVATRGYAAKSGDKSRAELEKTQEHLETFRDFLPALDKAGAWNIFVANDGLFDQRSLQLMAGNMNVPPELREAARFFLQRPDLFALLDIAARIGRSDGLVGLADIESMIDRVKAQIEEQPKNTKESVSARALLPEDASRIRESKVKPKTPSTSGGSDIRKILNDPSLSLEQKIQLILEAIMDKLDKKIEDTMDDLATAQDRSAEMKDEAASSKKSNHAKTAQSDREVDRVNQRLQKLMEQKKAMSDLLSNMSLKFSEMTKTAINNMGRS